jgi:6-phospho-3-hexuloisomerase
MTYDDVRFTALDELRPLLSAVDGEQVQRLTALLSRAPHVYLAGAGRSGLAMRAFAMRLMHLGIDARVVGDVTTPALAAGDLLVIGSGSGATASLVSLCQKARSLGGQIALVTTEPDSPIGRISDSLVCIAAPTPKAAGSRQRAEPSVQPMASLFEQALWILLDSCVMLLMRARGMSTDAMFARHANLE